MSGRTVLFTTRFIALTTLAACISVDLSKKNQPTPDYAFSTPSGDWQAVDNVSDTSVFRSKTSGSVLGLSISCDDTSASPFNNLVEALTAAVPEKTSESSLEALQGTPIPARVAHVKGVADDAPVEMLAIVLRSDRCVYDVLVTGRTLTVGDRKEAVRLARDLHVARRR